MCFLLSFEASKRARAVLLCLLYRMHARFSPMRECERDRKRGSGSMGFSLMHKEEFSLLNFKQSLSMQEFRIDIRF